MTVRVNSIQSPKEEMAELRLLIEHERQFRASCRISANPDYYASQKAYLEEQIKTFRDKLEKLTLNFQQSEANIAESRERQKRHEIRYAKLKHRDKIAKFEELQKQIEVLKIEIKGK